MMEAIKEESVGYMFNAEVTVTPHVHGEGSNEGVELETKGLITPKSVAALQYSGPNESGEVKTTSVSNDAYANVGRNEPCPCGSGTKYKKCHGVAS
jgi:preprotein translocase subunit SecA